MKRLTLALGMFVVLTATTLSVDIHETKLLSQPAVSKTHIVFAYAGDLWTANLDGQNVRRLTTDIGVESKRAATLDSVSDCSGVKPPSGKNGT